MIKTKSLRQSEGITLSGVVRKNLRNKGFENFFFQIYVIEENDSILPDKVQTYYNRICTCAKAPMQVPKSA
jgi:hypothetical protein